jgi:hypothetical protein
MRVFISLLAYFLIVTAALACPEEQPDFALSQERMPKKHKIAKIQFDLEAIDNDGLIGASDGKRYLGYEFCIPKQEDILQTVRSINPDLQFLAGSRGRIGCTESQYLVIGNTSSPNWRSQLLQLVELEEIQLIQQVFWE